MSDYLIHHGILGQKWGVRRYQNEDGSLTSAGRKRYLDRLDSFSNIKEGRKREKAEKQYRKIDNKIRLDKKVAADKEFSDSLNRFFEKMPYSDGSPEADKRAKSWAPNKAALNSISDTLRKSVSNAIGSDASREEAERFINWYMKGYANSLSFESWEYGLPYRYDVKDGKIIAYKPKQDGFRQ